MMQSASGSPSSFRAKIAQVTVEQQILPRRVLLRMDHQRFDQADLLDGGADRPVSPDVLLRILDLAHGQNVVK